jgi:hypothetical protein
MTKGILREFLTSQLGRKGRRCFLNKIYQGKKTQKVYQTGQDWLFMKNKIFSQKPFKVFH